MSLIVQDLTKRYGDKVVVDHLSFRMDQPGVYALLGSNGAGKTTSIRMMLICLFYATPCSLSPCFDATAAARAVSEPRKQPHTTCVSSGVVQ